MIGLQLLAMMGLSAGAMGSTSGQGQNQAQGQGGGAGGIAFQSMLGQLASGASAGGGLVISGNSATPSIEGLTGTNTTGGLIAGVNGTNGIGSELSALIANGGTPAQMVQGIINIANAHGVATTMENGQVFVGLGNQSGLIIENSNGNSFNVQSINANGEQTGSLTIMPNGNAQGLGETIINVISAYKAKYGTAPQQANGKPSDPDQPLILIGDEGASTGTDEGEENVSPLLEGLMMPASVDLAGLGNQNGMVVNTDGNTATTAQPSQGVAVSEAAKSLPTQAAEKQASGNQSVQSSDEPKSQASQQAKAPEAGIPLPEEAVLEDGEVTQLPIAGSKTKKFAKGKTGVTVSAQGNAKGKTSGGAASTIVNAAQSTKEAKLGDAISSADTTDKQAKLFDAIAQNRLMNDQMDKFGLKGNATTVQAAAASSVDPMMTQQGSSASQTILGAVQAMQGTTDASTHDISVANNTAPGRHIPTMPAAQLGMKITKAFKDGANEFQMRLDPAELGRIDVKLKFSASGKATAHIMAENKEALSLLQRDVHVLERALQDAGLKTDHNSLNFSLKEQGRDHERFAYQDNKKGFGTEDDEQDDLAPLSDEDITEAVIASMNMDQGLDIRI